MVQYYSILVLQLMLVLTRLTMVLNESVYSSRGGEVEQNWEK